MACLAGITGWSLRTGKPMDERAGWLDAAKILLLGVLLAPAMAMAMAQEAPSTVESADTAAARACGKASSIIYQPPQDLIVLAAKRLDQAGKQYQRNFDLVITVGEDGLVREALMAHSSGNRLLDVAARNWAFGQMFAPMDCSPADLYHIRIPIEIQ